MNSLYVSIVSTTMIHLCYIFFEAENASLFFFCLLGPSKDLKGKSLSEFIGQLPGQPLLVVVMRSDGYEAAGHPSMQHCFFY
jgi:hypothetical protein